MSYIGNSPKVNRLRLQPRATDPVSPAEGDLQYADGSAREEGLWVYKNSAWVKVGSEQSGQINYISNGDAETGNTSGWSLGNVSLTSAFPSGVPTFGSGANANLSFTNTTVTPIAGTRSLLYASSAATTAGNFVASDAFTVDPADRARVLQIAFNYQLVSGTANFSGTSSNSFGIAIYDVTASQWIMPAGVWNLVQSSGVGRATATFQTSATSTQYRLVIFNANATSGAVSLELDRISVGPQIQVQGPAVSDWVSFTPTGTWTTNTTYTGRWRRVGDTMQVTYKVLCSGAPNATGLAINLPVGYTIDTTKMSSTSASAVSWGWGLAYDSGVACYEVTPRHNNTTTSLDVVAQGAAGTYVNQPSFVNNTVPFTFGAADEVTIYAELPIAGWSSNSVMSQDTDTRVVAFCAQSISNLSSTPSDTQWTSSVVDTHKGFNGSTTYTVPVSGQYEINAVFSFVLPASGSFNSTSFVNLFKNGSSVNTWLAPYSTSVGNGNICPNNITITLDLKAGDTLKFQHYINSPSWGTMLAASTWSLKRLSGPAVVAASETVAARYTNTAGTSIANSGEVAVPFATKDYDTHNAFVADTFTVPVSGKYEVSSAIYFQSAAYTAGNNIYLVVYKNGSAANYGVINTASAITAQYGAGVTATLQCNAGDTLVVRAANNRSGGATALSTAANFNWITVKRIGN